MGVPVRPEGLRLLFIVEEDAPLVSLGHPFQALVELLQVLDSLGSLGTLLTQGGADLRCRVIENLTHRVQPETSLPVCDDSMQPLQVRVGALAIASGGAHGRRRRADLVPVMKRPDGHPTSSAATPTVTPSQMSRSRSTMDTIVTLLRRSRGDDSDRGEITRFLAVRIELLRRGEHDPRTLGGGHLDIASTPRRIPRPGHAARREIRTRLDEVINLAQHAQETHAHHRHFGRLGTGRDRNEQDILERPPAQVDHLPRDAEQFDKAEPPHPEIRRRRQVRRRNRHEHRHRVDAAEHLWRNRLRSTLGYGAHLECVEEITHAVYRPPSRNVRVKPNP
jgi:hypothetical protein